MAGVWAYQWLLVKKNFQCEKNACELINYYELTFVYNCFVNDMSGELNAYHEADGGGMAVITLNKLDSQDWEIDSPKNVYAWREGTQYCVIDFKWIALPSD